MRCCVFGIANHSPDDVVAALLRYRTAAQASDIGILPPMSKADTRHKFLLVLSTDDLARNMTRLDASGVKVFVFSNPIDLVSFSGVVNLDFVPVDDFAFNYQTLDLSKVAKSKAGLVHRVPSPFLTDLINSVKFGSLLNPLMTFIYSLSSQNQNLVKQLTVAYLYQGQSIQKFSTLLAPHLTERAINKLVSILDTSIGSSYAKALQSIRELRKKKSAVDISKVASETSTSSYELSYMLSVLDSVKATTYNDSFDRAKNRKTVHAVRVRK